MAKTVKRLYDLEIDEVSLVDRAANQHASVAFSKRDEENRMPEIFDSEGESVQEEELEHGDVVYDDQGNEYVFVEEEPQDQEYVEYEDDGSSAALDPEYDYEAVADGAYDDQLVGVGKAGGLDFMRDAGGQAMRVTRGARGGKAREFIAGAKGYTNATASRTNRSGAFMSRHRGFLGGTAVGGGAVHIGSRKETASKSLGNQVLEELSKALNENDRDEVIAKAMDAVQLAQESAEEAWLIAKSLQDERDTENFVSLAEQYELPVSPEVLGPILKRASSVLPEQDVEVLDRVFSAVGKGMYDEIGYNGTDAGSEIMEQVNALAYETVGKADLSHEQAVVALFETNPDAYDEYIRESR